MTIGPKSRDFNVNLKGPFVKQSSADGIKWVPYSSSTTQVDRVAVLTVANPWRAVKPVGLDPTNRTLTYYRTQAHQGEFRYKEAGGTRYRITGTWSTTIGYMQSANYGASVKTSLVNEAIFDALKKLKNQKFNAGVALAESEGVARMLVDAVSTTHSVLEAIHQKDFRGAYRRFRSSTAGRKYMPYPRWREQYWDEVKHVKSVRRARQIPEGWLYYHYGLKPTLNDLQGAVEAHAVIWRNNPELIYGIVSGYAKYKIKSVVPQNVGELHSDLHLSSLESVRVYLKVNPKDEFIAKMSELGVTNPPEAAWNRIPFSFLVDYFFSVGDYLSVLDSGLGWEFGDSVECYRRVKSCKSVANSSYPGTYFLRVAPATHFSKDISRQVKVALYAPMASVLPRLKLRNPSATQIANILSLVATGFKNTVRP